MNKQIGIAGQFGLNKANSVQVEKAFENLTEFSDAPERDVRFKVTCGPNGNKGIHIRTGVLDMPKEQNVVVEPIFLDADNIGELYCVLLNLVIETEQHYIANLIETRRNN